MTQNPVPRAKICVVCGAPWTAKDAYQARMTETCGSPCKGVLISKRRSRPQDELRALLVTKSRREGECVVWTGATREGYGRLGAHGRRRMAHQLAYELAKGPVPPGLVIDHLCRNRVCINPDHLEAVTHQENVRRGARASQTACKRGHPLEGYNLIVDQRGRRACRTCKNARRRAGGSKA